MIAIRLSKQNLKEILHISPIDRERLESMIREYDQPGRDPQYFIPQHSMAHSIDSESWMTVPKALMELAYDYDKAKIDRVFVEIKEKS